MTNKTKRRLRTLAEVVRTNYKLFDMDHWAMTNCKTTGCLAGLAVIHFAKKEWDTYEAGLKYLVNSDTCEIQANWRVANGLSVRPRAEELLGLTALVAANVFFTSNWPWSYQERFLAAKTQKKRAAIASGYLLDIADGKVIIDSGILGKAYIA